MIKNKTCWVITDGKIGTLNQCIGLADNLVRSYKIKTITLKKIWSLLNPYIKFDNINPCKNSTEIQGPYPDILIIGGRQTVSVGLYIKKQNPSTYLIGVQDPRISRNKFDLIILPEHDKYRSKNVLTTVGSMHKLTKDRLKEELIKFENKFKKLHKKTTISVLIGGNSKNHKMTIENTKRICEKIKQASLKLDANIIVTASRRTPKKCLKLIIQELEQEKNCYIWDNKGENPYFAMLEKADFIFVTNDSASMLSEATFTGKPVYLLELNGYSGKLHSFQKSLMKKGILKNINTELIKYKYKPIENAKEIANKIKRKIS